MNCLLKRAFEGKIEGRIEVKRRREKRSKQLLNGLKEKTGYWQLKQEVLDCSLCTASFGRGYGPVVRQTTTSTNVMTPWGKALVRNMIISFSGMEGFRITPIYKREISLRYLQVPASILRQTKPIHIDTVL